MATATAVARAMGGAPKSLGGDPIAPRENGDAMPQGGGRPEGGMNPEHAAAGIEAIGQLIQTEVQKGNPAARKYLSSFQGLLGFLAETVGGQAPQMPGGEPAAPPDELMDKLSPDAVEELTGKPKGAGGPANGPAKPEAARAAGGADGTMQAVQALQGFVTKMGPDGEEAKAHLDAFVQALSKAANGGGPMPAGASREGGTMRVGEAGGSPLNPREGFGMPRGVLKHNRGAGPAVVQ